MKVFSYIFLATFVLLNLTISFAQENETTKFTTCDGKISFEYPSTWSKEEEAIKTHIASFDSVRDEIQPFIHLNNDTAQIDIQTSPRLFLENSQLTVANYIGSSKNLDYGETEKFIVNNLEGAVVYYTDAMGNTGLEIAIALPRDILIITTVAQPPDNFADTEIVVDGLVKSIEVHITGENIVPDGWSTYFEDNCTFKFYYPENWVFNNIFNRTMIFNSLDAQNAYTRRDPLEESDLAIEVFQPERLISYFNGVIDLKTSTPEEVLTAYAGMRSIVLDQFAIEEIEIGEAKALVVQNPANLFVLFVYEDNEYGIFYAKSNTLADYEEDVWQIINSITYHPLEEEE
jgi:hypothetical protein